jgi:hypothetical protein
MEGAYNKVFLSKVCHTLHHTLSSSLLNPWGAAPSPRVSLSPHSMHIPWIWLWGAMSCRLLNQTGCILRCVYIAGQCARTNILLFHRYFARHHPRGHCRLLRKGVQISAQGWSLWRCCACYCPSPRNFSTHTMGSRGATLRTLRRGCCCSITPVTLVGSRQHESGRRRQTRSSSQSLQQKRQQLNQTR